MHEACFQLLPFGLFHSTMRCAPVESMRMMSCARPHPPPDSPVYAKLIALVATVATRLGRAGPKDGPPTGETTARRMLIDHVAAYDPPPPPVH